MNIHQPQNLQPTYANFTVMDAKRGEVILSLCFAEGDAKNPTATVVHKVVFQTANFARMIEAGQALLAAEAARHSDA